MQEKSMTDEMFQQRVLLELQYIRQKVERIEVKVDHLSATSHDAFEGVQAQLSVMNKTMSLMDQRMDRMERRDDEFDVRLRRGGL